MGIRLLILFTLSVLCCGGIRRSTYNGSLLMGVHNSRFQYHVGDTLDLDVEIANNGIRDEYISLYPGSFLLSGVPSAEYLTDLVWFSGASEIVEPDTGLIVLKSNQTKILSIPFVLLHDSISYDSLILLLTYRVTVEVDSVTVNYGICAQDTITLLTTRH